MNNQKAYTDYEMWVVFLLGVILCGTVIVTLIHVTAPTNPLAYDRTCHAEHEVVVLLEPAEGRGNSVPHACLDWDRVVRP